MALSRFAKMRTIVARWWPTLADLTSFSQPANLFRRCRHRRSCESRVFFPATVQLDDVNALRVRVRLAHGCWWPAPRSATVACFRLGAPPQFKVCRRPSCTFPPHIVKRDGGNHAMDEASGVSALPKAWRRVVQNPQLSIRQRVACCALRHLVQYEEQDFAPICWARHARGATRLEVLPPPLLLCRCCRCCRCHR